MTPPRTPNGAGIILLDAIARQEPLALTLIAEAGILPTGDNNTLARIAANAPINPTTIEAGGVHAIEAAATWARTSYFTGVAIGLRLRGVR